jgi:hypothetical protein
LFAQAGQRFGRGTVTDPEIRVRQGSSEARGARLRCDCGNVYESPLYALIRGAKTSCGCGNARSKYRDSPVKAGQRYGKGVVTDPDAGRHSSGHRLVSLRCDCGNTYTITYSQCLGGGTRSCGCLPGMRSHGLSRHPLYGTWTSMLHRCEDPGHKYYRLYGGRGIKVCDRWHDVAVFIEDIESGIGPRPKGMTLDRIDPNGKYEPGKVRWATQKEQIANRRPYSEWRSAGDDRAAASVVPSS